MLSKTEHALVKHLFLSGGGSDRDALLRDVLGYHADARTHTLETHIWRLRRKIEKSPDAPRILVTTPGGYRLNMAAFRSGTEAGSTTCSPARKAVHDCAPSWQCQSRAIRFQAVGQTGASDHRPLLFVHGAKKGVGNVVLSGC